MVHEMKLKEGPFDRIKEGTKTIEFRLYDEKRRKIKIDDKIEFSKKSKYRILNDKEYLKELNKKVLEEANEFIEENSIEELGDLMEVLNAIMKLKGYNLEDVNAIMKSKAEKKGAFNNKIFLEYVDETINVGIGINKKGGTFNGKFRKKRSI